MAKRKNRSKRSLSSLPKGIPVRGGSSNNPFDVRPTKRSKFDVANRKVAKNIQTNKLQQSLQQRQQAVRNVYKASQKANSFTDKRIGEYSNKNEMSLQERQLARLVQERSRQSKRRSKYALNDDDQEIVLTHRGKAVDQLTALDHATLLSDDEDEDNGQLDAADTSLHFGSGRQEQNELSMYGQQNNNMTDIYAARKNELDEIIQRRKLLKAQRLQTKERQVETFLQMDDAFSDLAEHLQFRDKEADIRQYIAQKREGTLSKEDQEHADWDKEMKTYLYDTSKKAKATDRIKTPEEVAQEEADRLQALETKRLARMNGDFDEDDLTDISDHEEDEKRVKKRRQTWNPEQLTDSDDDDSEEKTRTRLTQDGLVKINREGQVIGKVEDATLTKTAQAGTAKLAAELSQPLAVGTKVVASYRALEQFDGNESWFGGVVSRVHEENGKVTYDIDYDDGDFEEHVQPQHVQVVPKTGQELEQEVEETVRELVLHRKKKKATELARSEIPYVFEIPTTLDTLHQIIGKYASTGAEASLIVERIHKANSVRLDHRNQEKMQNFYDVLIRRFIAIGDAIHSNGNGGPELSRYQQLDSLIKTMYAMAQDSPDCAGAVWNRRLGFFQNAHTKRLRDAQFVPSDNEDDFSAWPSLGTILALRAVGHIFPVTDMRHPVVTPALLLLAQIISQTPILSASDLGKGLFCTGLLLEYTNEAKRVVPEALGFLAGTIRLFAAKSCERKSLHHPLPSLAAAANRAAFTTLRQNASEYHGESVPRLSLEEKSFESSSSAAGMLFTALHLVEVTVKCFQGSIESAEKEAFASLASSILVLEPRHNKLALDHELLKKASAVVSVLSDSLSTEKSRAPLQRRKGLSVREKGIKSLAPRLENIEKYSLSKDKGKTAAQAAADRVRREYKQEHKAVARELRMDASMMESERRRTQDEKNSSAKAKRQRAFAWLEGEQATLNQQVRQGGGLLQGGGIGAAKAKAASAKLGIKKGGKF